MQGGSNDFLPAAGSSPVRTYTEIRDNDACMEHPQRLTSLHHRALEGGCGERHNQDNGSAGSCRNHWRHDPDWRTIIATATRAVPRGFLLEIVTRAGGDREDERMSHSDDGSWMVNRVPGSGRRFHWDYDPGRNPSVRTTQLAADKNPLSYPEDPPPDQTRRTIEGGDLRSAWAILED